MKAQLWSTDFALSAVIFFLALGIMVFAWNYTTIQAQESLLVSDLENSAILVSDFLARDPGYPQDWNTSNVQVIGLASSENILNPGKIQSFLNMSYSKAKILLSIGDYEFHFEVLYMNSTLINGLSFGSQPTNAEAVVPIERPVLYQGSPARMKLIIWK